MRTFLKAQITVTIFLLAVFITSASGNIKPCAISRHDNRMDVFWIDAQGGVWNIGWENGVWGAASMIVNPGAAEGGANMAAAARSKDALDIFWIGKGGSIVTSSWSAQAPVWSQPRLVSGPGTASPQGGLAAVSRQPEHLDVFWIAPDGSVRSNWWNANLNYGYWNTPFQVAGPNAATAGSKIAAVARMRDHLDVFWIAPNGAVSSNWWNAGLNNGRWNAPFQVAGTGSASPAGGISALSRGAHHLEIYWVALNGSISNTWFDGKWNTPIAIAPAGSARTDSDVAARARRPDHADVCWIAPDGSVRSNWWNAGVNQAKWNAPFAIAPAHSAAPGGGLAVLYRQPEHLEVFWPQSNDQIMGAWWMSSANNGMWNAPFALWTKARFTFLQTSILMSDAALETFGNTYKAKDGRINKLVKPAGQGDNPKANLSASGAVQEQADNGFVCTSTPVTESQSSFEALVLANPTELFYPGAVLEARSIADGSYRLQAPVYSALRLSINLLGAGAGGSNTTVVQPSGGKIYRGSVYDGISQLLRNTATVGNAANAEVDVRVMESQEELEMFLGGSFSGWGASVSANMGMSKQQKRNVIYVKYVQKDFSVLVDSPPHELFPQHTFGQYPGWCMVQKVNYGRMAIVRFESDYSAEELNAGIKASYDGLGYGAKATFNINTQKVLDETTASAVFIGGDPTLAGEAIGSLLGKSAREILDKLKHYIVKGALSNKNISVTPISYELVFLDGSRAMVQTNTSYVNRECKPLAREVEFTFEGLMAFDDIYDKFNQGGSGYNFYTGYQNDRSKALTLTVYYTDAPGSRKPEQLVLGKTIWNANADQPIYVISSASTAFKPELRKPFDEIKGAALRLAPFGDPQKGGGVFIPKVRIPLDPDMLRNNQVLIRVEGQVSREMTFDDEAMYPAPATANEYLLSEVFGRHFALEYKHNGSERRCFLQFLVQPLY